MYYQALRASILSIVVISTTELPAESTQSYTESPEVMQIVENFNDRLRHYHGLEFEYEVSFHAEGNVGGEYKTNSGHSINRVRFADPIQKGSLQPRVYWEKNIEAPGEPLFEQDRVTSQWIAFNGNETRQFKQAFLIKPTRFIESEGLIRPGPGLGLIRESEDCFLAFISNDIYHSMTYMRNFDPKDLLGEFKVSVLGNEQHIGEDCIRVRFDPVPDLPYGTTHESLLTVKGAPMVLHSEVGAYGEIGDSGFLEQVTKVGSIEGIKFPAEGTYINSFSDSILKGEFKVLNVRRLSESEIQNWFPEWPSGTSVVDEGAGTVTRIPYTAEQQDIIRRFMLKRTALSAIGWGSVTMMLFNLTAVGIIGYFIFRKVRASFS